MNKFFKILNFILDWLKNSLVRFKRAGFGIFFIKNLFIIPDFFMDRECNFFSKFKVVFAFLATLLYFTSSFDLIPEFLLGGLGFLDDLLILIWSIGFINDEFLKYKNLLENGEKSTIIENVDWKIRDDE